MPGQIATVISSEKTISYVIKLERSFESSVLKETISLPSCSFNGWYKSYVKVDPSLSDKYTRSPSGQGQFSRPTILWSTVWTCPENPQSRVGEYLHKMKYYCFYAS